MSFDAGAIVAQLRLNAKDFFGKMTRADRVSTRFRKTMNRNAQAVRGFGLAMTAAAVPLNLLSAGIVKAASDAQESEQLFEVTMKNQADAARKWSMALQESLSISGFEARKSAGIFNIMFESMNVGADDARKMSTGLTQLAFDLESIFNLRPGQGFVKLQSAIAGEVEPLRRLGPDIREATIAQFAYANGIAKTGAVLNTTQKAYARYGLIIEQTKTAQGDLARTIDFFANQFRIFRQQISLTSIELGSGSGGLLEIATKFLRKINGGLIVFRKWSEANKEAATSLTLLVSGTGAAMVGFGAMMLIMPGLIQSFGILGSSVLWFGSIAMPVMKSVFGGLKFLVVGFQALQFAAIKAWMAVAAGGLIVVAKIALIGALLYTLRAIWNQNFNGIQEIVKSLGDWLTKVWRNILVNTKLLMDGMSILWSKLQDIVGPIFKWVADAWNDVVTFVAKKLQSMLGDFHKALVFAKTFRALVADGVNPMLAVTRATEEAKKSVFSLGEAFSLTFTEMKKLAVPTIEEIADEFKELGEAVKQQFTDDMNSLAPVLEKFNTMVKGAFGLEVKDLGFNNALEMMKQKFPEYINLFEQLKQLKDFESGDDAPKIPGFGDLQGMMQEGTGFLAYFKSLKAELKAEYSNLTDFMVHETVRTVVDMESSMADFFSETIKGTQSFKETLTNFFQEIGNAFIEMVGRMIARWIMFKIITTGASIATGGISSLVTTAADVAPNTTPQFLDDNLFQGSGFNLRSGGFDNGTGGAGLEATRTTKDERPPINLTNINMLSTDAIAAAMDTPEGEEVTVNHITRDTLKNGPTR